MARSAIYKSSVFASEPRLNPKDGTPDRRNSAHMDEKDGEVGIIGYEINFNRYFYRYVAPRPLEEIEADIRSIENDIMRMLAEVTGGQAG